MGDTLSRNIPTAGIPNNFTTAGQQISALGHDEMNRHLQAALKRAPATHFPLQPFANNKRAFNLYPAPPALVVLISTLNKKPG
jgi:hypothetical protein